MTLIIGIKCSDGIVMGADGAATFGAMGQRTIRQPVKKLTILEECIVVGVSGPVGLAQRFTGEIHNLWMEKKFSGRKPFEAMTIIRESIGKHSATEFQAAAMARQVIGPVAAESAIASAIAALPISKSPCLFQFDQQGAPEEASADLPFAAIGSGQSIADPFLAFLRRIFWANKQPSLADGIFAVLWTLEHAIQTNPGGVSEPKQVVVLEKCSDKWKARELAPEEFEEHIEAIGAAEQSLANFREALRGEKVDGQEIQPPQP